MHTELLKVTGMTCGGCVSKVTKALQPVPGVSDAKVSLQAGEATVQFDEQVTSSEQLRSAVQRAGYGVDITLLAPGQQPKGGCCV